MYIFLTVLIIIMCVLLVMIVLIQNPKGSGLGAAFGGQGSQIMGVQRTTDFLEKATWTLAITLLALSLLTSFFIDKATINPNASEIDQQVEDAPAPFTVPQQNLPPAQ